MRIQALTFSNLPKKGYIVPSNSKTNSATDHHDQPFCLSKQS